MKKIVILIALLGLFSCTKESEELPDVYNSYLKIVNPIPASGSVLTSATNIKVKIDYNISISELEGLGFRLTYWSGVKDGEEIGWESKNLKLRKDTYDHEFEISDFSIEQLKGETISFYVSISRKIADNRWETVIASDKISYIIK